MTEIIPFVCEYCAWDSHPLSYLQCEECPECKEDSQ